MGHALWRDLLSPSETRKEARLSSSEAFKQENPYKTKWAKGGVWNEKEWR